MIAAKRVCIAAAILLAIPVVAVSQERSGESRPRARPWPIHDPSTIVKQEGEFWVFSTGQGIQSARSKNLSDWTAGPAVFARSPKWIAEVVPGNRGHFWAPDVIHHDGRYLLYYSISTFGKNTSAIALASSPTLNPADPQFKWTDHGVVIRTGPRDRFNAIDPCVVHGLDDSLWMAFGSFWSGIKLVQLDPKTGLRLSPDGPIHDLASKEQIEAAALHWRDGYYYLFVNWGWCCRGVRSTYSIRVGRSRDITGPYVDKQGIDLRAGGGSLVLGTEGRFIGPGHAGLLQDGERCLLSYHFYDGERGGRAHLAIRPLAWGDDGWPRVDGEPITPPAAD